MKIRTFLVFTLVACFTVAAAGVLKAQSLGELARQQKAKQASQPKATKVFTNEDMPKATTLQSTESEAEGDASPETAAKKTVGGEASSDSGEKKSEETSPDDKKKTKEYWQEQFQNAKADLNKAQEQSKLSDDELSLAQADAARQLDADKRSEADKNVATKQSAADAKHAALDKATQAMEDLKKQFEESGAPADWLPADDNNQ